MIPCEIHTLDTVQLCPLHEKVTAKLEMFGKKICSEEMESLYTRKRQNSKDILAYKVYTLRDNVLEVAANIA